MKIKMKKKAAEPEPVKAKKAKTAPAEEPVKKRNRVVGTATSPILLRAKKVCEYLNSIETLLTACALELETWTAADGALLKDVASQEDATYYWALTKAELGSSATGQAWMADTRQEPRHVLKQIQDIRWGFQKVVDAAKPAPVAETKPAKKLGKGKKKK